MKIRAYSEESIKLKKETQRPTLFNILHSNSSRPIKNVRRCGFQVTTWNLHFNWKIQGSHLACPLHENSINTTQNKTNSESCQVAEDLLQAPKMIKNSNFQQSSKNLTLRSTPLHYLSNRSHNKGIVKKWKLCRLKITKIKLSRCPKGKFRHIKASETIVWDSSSSGILEYSKRPHITKLSKWFQKP